MRYLRAIGYFLMSQCATGPARESKVCPGRAAAGGFNLAARPLDRTRVLRIWGVHWVILEGCAFLYLPVIIGVCIPMHTPFARGNAHPSIHPGNSGPIQWARGGVGLKPSAAARPDGLGWKKINQRTYHSYTTTVW